MTFCFSMCDNQWVRLLAYVGGLVNQNFSSRMSARQRRIGSPECSTFAQIGGWLGRKDLQLVASFALEDTIRVVPPADCPKFGVPAPGPVLLQRRQRRYLFLSQKIPGHLGSA
jgi:hypothetical protein